MGGALGFASATHCDHESVLDRDFDPATTFTVRIENISDAAGWDKPQQAIWTSAGRLMP